MLPDNITPMYSDIRIGNFPGYIGDLAKKYSPNFMRVPGGRPEIHKYGWILREKAGNRTESYIIMVSNQILEDPTFNMMLTVFGPRKQRVSRLRRGFEKKTGIKTIPAPEHVKRNYEGITYLMGILGIATEDE